jgi:hypothetical protein
VYLLKINSVLNVVEHLPSMCEALPGFDFQHGETKLKYALLFLQEIKQLSKGEMCIT